MRSNSIKGRINRYNATIGKKIRAIIPSSNEKRKPKQKESPCKENQEEIGEERHKKVKTFGEEISKEQGKRGVVLIENMNIA